MILISEGRKCICIILSVGGQMNFIKFKKSPNLGKYKILQVKGTLGYFNVNLKSQVYDYLWSTTWNSI